MKARKVFIFSIFSIYGQLEDPCSFELSMKKVLFLYNCNLPGRYSNTWPETPKTVFCMEAHYENHHIYSYMYGDETNHFCHLLITFANCLDPDQARQNIGPDLDPNCLF